MKKILLVFYGYILVCNLLSMVSNVLAVGKGHVVREHDNAPCEKRGLLVGSQLLYLTNSSSSN